MSASVDDFTVPEKILLAADQLDKTGQSPFSAEALTVAAWQKFPKTFGLKGYTELHPDNNKILAAIMGEKGLARRGWLSKMGQKLYALTCPRSIRSFRATSRSGARSAESRAGRRASRVFPRLPDRASRSHPPRRCRRR